MVDPRDVAVGPKAAQLALEAVHEVEGGLRRLRSVPLVGVRRVHLEHGVHRFVRETPYVAEFAWSRNPEPAVEIRATGTHEESGPERR